MSGRSRAAAVPRRGRRSAAHGAPTPTRAARSSASSKKPRRLVEGLSIDEAFLDVRGLEHIPGRPAEIAARLRRDVREQVGLPGDRRRRADEVPREGRERRREAGRPARRAARRRARLSAPASGRAGVGGGAGDGAEAPRARARDGRRGRASVAEAALVAMLGRGDGRRVHALAWNRDPRPGAPAPPSRVDRRAAGARAVAAAGGRRRGGRCARRARRRAACARPGASVARSSSACGSRTSPVRRGRRRSRTRPANTQHDPRRGARRCSPRPRRRSRARGSRSSASRSRTSTTATRCSSCCRSTRGATRRSTPRSTSVRGASGTTP